ncbi:nickel pincer cofactor biosynthesis protein LarC [Butyrivibrio sp. XPD2006]|uniref:nickel pincer cofactor biosynthesis protein LarC n=1 Tax=Butyrivibrio sp. XPD2006 TaxID=1280668 RepID=UPI0003B3AE65|nr:nickel pincer cofactor biosynthesis protein LarC [Butyrivibrio sp. XPD2006]
MKTLYLECKMGIAGDMMASALLGLFEDKNSVIEALNAINVPNVVYKLDQVKKCGILGDHISVLVDGVEEISEDVHEHYHDHEHHSHNSIDDIEEIIEGLNISKEIKSDIREVYQLLAQAESKVHGESVSQIHFHEVGEKDAIADITAVCYLLHELDPDKVIVSPINVGNGQVKCAHGILPVPAPATALLLEGIPTYSPEKLVGELCTPTGAALVKYFAFDFGAQPVMTVEKIGYGMGKKDFEQANCVRAMIGVSSEEAEKIIELSCNIDDMTGEELGFATEMLFEEGALDVYTISIDMKKNRLGFLLTCLCNEDDKEKLLKAMFKYTTTLGIREQTYNRYTMLREIKKIDTPYGEIRVKKSYGHGIKREKLEYDDLAGIARRTGKSIIELKNELESSF